MAICIEITSKDDGSFSVVECEPETPAMEGQEGEGAGQSFQDIKSALMAAAEMLTSAQVADPAQAQGMAETDMAQGFDSVRGRGLNG